MTKMDATAAERAWDLYTLKQSLEEQLQDVDALLREALREAYEDEGTRKLSNGYTIKRSVTRDISLKAFAERFPELCEGALRMKRDAYVPELTKKDVKGAIAATGASKEEQAEMLASIETGGETVRFSLTKPLDPNPGKVVE